MGTNDKERMLSHLRIWYRSHARSMEYNTEKGYDAAAEYHEKQMRNIIWMAETIKAIQVDEGTEVPF